MPGQNLLGNCLATNESNQLVNTAVLHVVGNGSLLDGTESWTCDSLWTFTRKRPFSATPSATEFVLPKGSCDNKCFLGPSDFLLGPTDNPTGGVLTRGASTWDITTNFDTDSQFNTAGATAYHAFGIVKFDPSDHSIINSFVFINTTFDNLPVSCDKRGVYTLTQSNTDYVTYTCTLTFTLTLS